MSEPTYTGDFAVIAPFQGGHAILAITRKKEPFKNHVALPGGKHDRGDRKPIDTAVRELREETTVRIDPRTQRVMHIGHYAAKGRDPRGDYRTDLFGVVLHALPKAKARDDAASVLWVPLTKLDTVRWAFDHRALVNDAINTLEW